ncbi:UNVERIFIED_CONTAM: hypothetical protein FKN15_066134 [Acipenser sinensis]
MEVKECWGVLGPADFRRQGAEGGRTDPARLVFDRGRLVPNISSRERGQSSPCLGERTELAMPGREDRARHAWERGQSSPCLGKRTDLTMPGCGRMRQNTLSPKRFGTVSLLNFRFRTDVKKFEKMALMQGDGDLSLMEINCDLGPNLSDGAINTRLPDDDGVPEERDHKLQCYSKRSVTELLEKYRELLKKGLDRKALLPSGDLLQNLQLHLDAAVQENITINGDTWEAASEEQPQNDADNKSLDDLLDEHILETVLRRKHYPKKILPYIVRRLKVEREMMTGQFYVYVDADNKSLDDLLDEHILETVLRRKHYPKKILPYIVRRLKVEREMMGLYQQVVAPQKITSDQEQDAKMKNVLASAPGMAKQASTVMKSLQALLQKAEGLSQVMGMEPDIRLSKAHQAVFKHEETEEKSNTNCLASPLESFKDDGKRLKRREKNRVAAQRSRKKQTQKADKIHELFFSRVKEMLKD